MWELNFFVLGGPLWIPFVFASFVIGRRQITVPQMIVFAFAEVAAFAAVSLYLEYR
jgi:hypothetical protein